MGIIVFELGIIVFEFIFVFCFKLFFFILFIKMESIYILEIWLNFNEV